MHLGKVALIGVGLLGGSLGRALRQRQRAREVVGFARRAETLRECAATGATDRTSLDLADAVQDADLVVLGTPLGEMEPMTRRLLPLLKPGAWVTDVGSVKARVVAALEPLVASAGATFVGSHPMAGGERTGVLASRADLFEGAVCVVTPTATTPDAAVEVIGRLWEGVGARVLRLAPEAHDVLVSRSSHLPHVVAAELARFVLDPRHPDTQRALCATGFGSTTRIASGSPEMWRDITLANPEALLGALTAHIDGLRAFQELIRRQDGPALLEYFAQAKERRDAWCAPQAGPSHQEPRTERP